jgi:flagellar assembly protein FliH
VEVTVEIHPEDVEFIEAAKEDFFRQVKALKHMAIVPDPSVNPGGCRVKTRFGEVDATLESRLDAIQRTLMDVYRNRFNDAGSV